MPTKEKKRDPVQSAGRLVAAAVEVFSAHGPDAATVDEICAKAGLNKRMAYHYFGSKAGLYKEAILYVYDQFLSLEVELAAMLLSPEQLLETLVGKYYDFLRDHPAFVRLLCYENLNEGRVVRKLNLRSKKAPIISALRLALEKGQTEKKFRRDIDVNDLLVSIFALCFFYFSNRYTMRQILDEAVMADSHIEVRKKHVVDLVLKGLVTERELA
ncbi:MAG: TetR family transcriptional regulator [Phycisphaerae bacterium]|nr:TetR family transcriptional regulator [Phycisphaerae bacterium]